MKSSRKPVATAKSAPHRLIALALLALTLGAYSNSFDAGFALDNRGLILQDPRLRAATGENLGLILSHTYWWPYGESGLYRPLTTLSYLLNYAVLGNAERAAGYHAANLLLHALNVLLAYGLARRFLPGLWQPAAVAGLWAVHPALTESVTNIIGRADLLAGASVLGGFWLYLKSAEAAGSRRAAWLVSLAAATTVGVFSKESAVAILGVAALYELIFRRPRERSLLPAYAALLLPILAMWWWRSRVLAASPRAVLAFTDNPVAAAGFWQAKLTALAVLGRYVWLMLWPQRLSSDYSFAQIPLGQGSLADWAAWLTFAVTLAAAVVLYRRSRAGSFFILFALINLAPVANLLFPIGTIMADRFLYLPALGACACVVMAAYALLRSPARATGLLALIAFACAARTVARNADWHDDVSLASADVEVSPRSFKTHYRLAEALYESDSGHAGIDGVVEEAEKSLAILNALPDDRNTPTVYRSAGRYYLAKADRLQGKGSDGKATLTPASQAAYRRSAEVLERCLSILAAVRAGGVNPAPGEEADVRRMLADDYLNLSDLPRALASALVARRLDPLSPQAYWLLFDVFMSREQAFEAATMLVEGGVITGDPTMREELIRLYQMGLDERGCAIAAGSGALNPACEIVHTQFCAAAADLNQLSVESRRIGVSAELNQIPVSGCSGSAAKLFSPAP